MTIPLSMHPDCNIAVRLHLVTEDVKPDLRAARVADTEERIVRAATELFAADGYAATTLAAVAEAAGVGARTVYVRFGTKAALLKRVVDVAIVGDTAPVDVAGRDWFAVATSAPTAGERIAAIAAASRDMMARAGDVLAVAQQAEHGEEIIAAAAQAGREATLANFRTLWSTMDKDGLLPAGADVEWLVRTTATLAAADTFLLYTRMHGHSPAKYGTWLETSLHRLLAASVTSTDGSMR
jgi:AcrR family transcriptional regulator